MVSVGSINLSWDQCAEWGGCHSRGAGEGLKALAAFGSFAPEWPGEPEAGLQKAMQTRKGTRPLYCWQERNRIVGVLFPLWGKKGICKRLSHWRVVWSWTRWEFAESWCRRKQNTLLWVYGLGWEGGDNDNRPNVAEGERFTRWQWDCESLYG